MVRFWGPGLVLTASVVGSGELIATTGLGAKTGFIALWLILLSCVIKVAIQLVLARLAISTGATALHALNQLPGPRYRASWFVWLWLAVMVMVCLQQGAMLGGVAMVMNLFVPGIPVWVWAVLIAGLTIVLLRGGRYSFLERCSMAMVAVFTLTTVICVVMLHQTDYRVSWENVMSGLTFKLPSGGIAVAVAMFGITGVGATELIFYTYVCLEKGYARSAGAFDNTAAWYARARGWIRVMHWDALLSMAVYTVLTVAFYLLGASVLHSRSVIPEGMDMIRNLSLMYTETLGPGARNLFLVGAFFALYSTVFVSTAANARMITDCVHLLGAGGIRTGEDRDRWIRATITALPLFQLFLFLVLRQPLWMVIVGGTSQTVSLIAIALGALYLRRAKLDPQLKPSSLFEVLIWVSAGTIAAVAVYGIWIQLP